MNSTGDYEYPAYDYDFEDYAYDFLAKWDIICAVLSSTIIVIGVLGNLLTVLVFLTRERRKSNIGIYLSALAIADILVLTLPAMEFWLILVLHRFIRHSSDFLCKLLPYVTFVLPCVSAWILVAVSMDRMLRVCAPLKMNVLSKPKHAILVVAAVTVTVSAIFLPLIPGCVLERFGNISTCHLHKSIITAKALSDLSMAFLFAAPFLIMLINNSIILVKVAGCAERYCGKSRESDT
ncbi:CCKAR-like protein, partial [Mya arenaria]